MEPTKRSRSSLDIGATVAKHSGIVPQLIAAHAVRACTYVDSVRDMSKIVCYHQVLFVAVNKLQQFEEKKN